MIEDLRKRKADIDARFIAHQSRCTPELEAERQRNAQPKGMSRELIDLIWERAGLINEMQDVIRDAKRQGLLEQVI